MIEQPQSRHSAFQVLTGLLSLPAGARVGIGPMLAALTLVTIVLASILAPLYVPYDPLAMNSAARLKPPSEEFLLGTDPYGRDTFSRVMVGGRVSLLIGVGAALVRVKLAQTLHQFSHLALAAKRGDADRLERVEGVRRRDGSQQVVV